MKCTQCNTEMQVRDGRFGQFYFCPNQLECGQKTISKSRKVVPATSCNPDTDILEASNDSLVIEMRLMQEQLGPLFAPSGENFVNELGEDIDIDGNIIYDFRPEG